MVVLIAAGCGYENAVPFAPEAGPVDAPSVTPDAAAATARDLAPAADLPGQDLAADAAPSTSGDAAAGETAASCSSCYTEALASAPGACKVAKPNGCDDIPAEGVGMDKTTGDRALCQALDACMKTTKCWDTDNGPSDCFCGTASKLDCTTAKANGPCKAEIMAATKSTTELLAGTLLFSPNLPSGFAAQKYACYHSACREACR